MKAEQAPYERSQVQDYFEALSLYRGETTHRRSLPLNFRPPSPRQLVSFGWGSPEGRHCPQQTAAVPAAECRTLLAWPVSFLPCRLSSPFSCLLPTLDLLRRNNMRHFAHESRVGLLEKLHKREHPTRSERSLPDLRRKFYEALNAICSGRVEIVGAGRGAKADNDDILRRLAGRVRSFRSL